MKKKFYKKGFRKPRKDESSSTLYECNKPRHINKGCPMLKYKYKKSKRKKALDVEWDESEPSDSEDEKSQEAMLSIADPNICFMANENEVIIDDCMSLEEFEDAHMELMEEYKKLSKKFIVLKNLMHLALHLMKMC